jgi:hypothetical protein
MIPENWPEILTAVGTLLTGVVAIAFGLWGTALRRLFYKPNMKLVDHHENLQGIRSGKTQGHTRLKFVNDGKSIAEEVNVYIDEIIDNKLLREEFLPVPLSWTHDGRYMRNFAPHETWFLDFCRRDNVINSVFPVFVLAAGQGVPNYEDVFEGTTIVKIRLSDKSGSMRRYRVELFWKVRDPYVQVKRIKEMD